MAEDIDTFCRLCAEATKLEQLIPPESDVAKSSEITKKMSWINVDVTDSNLLPRTVCFSCFDLLEKTWKFLQMVRNAQIKLNEEYIKKLGLPSDCEIKPVAKVADVGKPVDEAWEDFKEDKSELKIEIDIKEQTEINCVDPQTLLDVRVKKEYESDFGNDDNLDSESDMPLKQVLNKRKIKKKPKGKRGRKKLKVEMDDVDMYPDLNAEAIPIDISMFSMTWDDYKWRCALCDAQCKTLASLRLHSLEIHQCCCVFKCLDCSKIITNHKSFVNHVKLHCKSLKTCCEFCNKVFGQSVGVKKHKSTDHDLSNMCPNCGANFDSNDQLKDHILAYAKGYRPNSKKKREIKEIDLKCGFCDKEFKSKSNLQAHLSIHRDRSREFSCHICGRQFFTKGTLSTHMSIHEDFKPFKCDFCSMEFRARGNLISHISLHSDSRPYICDKCGKSFRVKRHLKSHAIVHTDLMPFACPYCSKKFRFKTRLNLHLRQHTGAKPYSCVYCQRDFTNGSNFKKHMLRRHNMDVSRKKNLGKKVDFNIQTDIDTKPQNIVGGKCKFESPVQENVLNYAVRYSETGNTLVVNQGVFAASRV